MTTTHVQPPVYTGMEMTAEELAGLPANGNIYELVRGELVTMVPASARHGRIAMQIGHLLTQYVRQHRLGAVYAAETGFQIARDPDTVRAADVAFVARERIPPTGEPDGYWAIAPDLVVEVISPSDSAPYLQAKVTDWLRAGVRRVWVVYPDTCSVVVYEPSGRAITLTENDDLDGEDVLPGFRCPVREIFD